MTDGYVEKIINATKVNFRDGDFFYRVHRIVSKYNQSKISDKNRVEKFLLEEYTILSKDVDEIDIQDSCIVRGNLRARGLARLLIDKNGQIDNDLLDKTIEFLKDNLYSFGPNRHHDIARQEHILDVLEKLKNDERLRNKLLSMSKPHSNMRAEKLIRDSLLLHSSVKINDVHVRRAALYAWLTYLRQNVGSCFATAPSILIQQENPLQFLTDLDLLLNTCRLKRTYGGVEYSAPMSNSWGASDLRKYFIFTKKVAKSPGFLIALQEAGVIEKELHQKEKIKISMGLIKKSMTKLNFVQGMITPEKLIRAILLSENNISEQDVFDYENRLSGMMYTRAGVVAQKTNTHTQVTHNACKIFFKQFEDARAGFKALTDCALLKSWEFTIASFSEAKPNFCQWNLYSSLGLQPEEPFGIGESIYKILKEELDRANTEVQESQEKYEGVFIQVKYLEGRINRATTEEELRWMKADYNARVNEMNNYLNIRDHAHQRAAQLASFFPFLIDQYHEYFSKYFQEVYDADIGEDVVSFYDDRPAGFHLLYKHGRSNPSQWTIIETPDQFIDALAQFFVATETEIVSKPELNGLQEIFSRVVTAIEMLIKTKEFLETALMRMAKVHKAPLIKDPLNNLDKVEKKPWVYTSGGSMDTLLCCYYCREEKPTIKSHWVENENELLVFFLDTMKHLHTNVKYIFDEEEGRGMLMHSPTHAFILKPGFKFFKDGWQNDVYTYTWVKENFVLPAQKFLARQKLDSDMMMYVVDVLAKKLPKPTIEPFKSFFSTLSGGNMMTQDFRDYIVRMLEGYWESKKFGEMPLSVEEIDSTFYSVLPFTLSYDLRDNVRRLFDKLGVSTDKVMFVLEKILDKGYGGRVICAKSFMELCKSLLIIATKKTRFSVDYHEELYSAARELGLALPKPIVFADTNWPKDYFAFVVNPGSGKVELWRTDEVGSEGVPMNCWKQFVDGSLKREWGIYTSPKEYTSQVPIGQPRL